MLINISHLSYSTSRRVDGRSRSESAYSDLQLIVNARRHFVIVFKDNFEKIDSAKRLPDGRLVIRRQPVYCLATRKPAIMMFNMMTANEVEEKTPVIVQPRARRPDCRRSFPCLDERSLEQRDGLSQTAPVDSSCAKGDLLIRTNVLQVQTFVR